MIINLLIILWIYRKSRHANESIPTFLFTTVTKKVENVKLLHEATSLSANFTPSAQSALLFDKAIALLSQYHPFPQTQAGYG